MTKQKSDCVTSLKDGCVISWLLNFIYFSLKLRTEMGIYLIVWYKDKGYTIISLHQYTLPFSYLSMYLDLSIYIMHV